MMTPTERAVALEQMRQTSHAFYANAVRIGNHPFIEFCGLMNEYIKACQKAHEQGIDFTSCNAHTGLELPLEPYMVGYVNEKLECIFNGRVKMVKKENT